MSDIGYDDETTALVVTSSPPTQRIKDGTTERTRITSIAVKCVAVMVGILAIVSLSSVIGDNDHSKTVGFDLSEAALLRSSAPVYDPKKDNCFQRDQEGWSVEMLEDEDWDDPYCWSSSDSFKSWKLVGGPGYKKVGPPIVINGICGSGKMCELAFPNG